MRTSILATLILTLAVGCSTETGILIHTTADAELAPQIDSLQFYVGVELIWSRDNMEEAGPRHFYDNAPSKDVALAGRDLVANPYQFLIRPGDESEIMVVVWALDVDGETIGLGYVGPLSFVSGQVSQWDIEIGDPSMLSDRCWILGEEGNRVKFGRPGNLDCDPSLEDVDCDDLDPDRYPGNTENCTNGIDDDCNDLVDEADDEDSDNDGYYVCGDRPHDCNNNDSNIHPMAEEVCDGKDNDCNGICDDADGEDSDAITSCGTVIENGKCVATGPDDCDNDDELIFPGALEVCDGKDNNCSLSCDDDPAFDSDNDGYTTCGSVIGDCEVEMDDTWADCDDSDFGRHPGAYEYCDDIDWDCDGETSPATSLCTTRDTQCSQGKQSCDNGVLVGSCQKTEATGNEGFLPIEPELCTVYEDCVPPPSDPASCLISYPETTGLVAVDCQVSIGAGDQCDQNLVRIPTIPLNGEVENCGFSLIGGELQQGYRLNLIDPMDGSVEGAVIKLCRPSILLEVIPLPGAGEATIMLDVFAGTTQELIAIKLGTSRYGTCGAKKGLECTDWANVLFPGES